MSCLVKPGQLWKTTRPITVTCWVNDTWINLSKNKVVMVTSLKKKTGSEVFINILFEKFGTAKTAEITYVNPSRWALNWVSVGDKPKV